MGGSVAGWSSLAARRAHNPKVAGSNPAPATNLMMTQALWMSPGLLFRGCFSWLLGSSFTEFIENTPESLGADSLVPTAELVECRANNRYTIAVIVQLALAAAVYGLLSTGAGLMRP